MVTEDLKHVIAPLNSPGCDVVLPLGGAEDLGKLDPLNDVINDEYVGNYA